MRPWIYLDERRKGRRGPDETATNSYSAPCRRAGLNRGEELASLAIDLINGAVGGASLCFSLPIALPASDQALNDAELHAVRALQLTP